MHGTVSSSILRRLADCLVTFSIYFLYAGSLVPGVNETHYWIKAKHFWNPNFVAGDLFAESSDAHWFFFWTTGWITLYFSLTWTAWITRVIGWAVLSCTWCHLAHVSVGRSWSGSLSSLLFLTCIHYGHLSGEWIVGGMEAKIFAYAALWLGLASMSSNRWNTAWIWLGISSAFHVLVGGWATLTLMTLYAWSQRSFLPWSSPWRRQWIGLAIGGSLALLGLIPAILVNRGSSMDVQSQGAWLHVYYRLAHHLSPLAFSSSRWICFGVLFVFSIALYWCWKQGIPTEDSQEVAMRKETETIDRLWWIAWASCVIALIGLFVDVAIAPFDEYLAANLLRYYWFRWNDVAIPMAVSLTITYLSSPRRLRYLRWPVTKAIQTSIALMALILPGGGLLVSRFRSEWDARLPQAESMSLVFDWESQERRSAVYDDWQRVCEWIRETTPERTVWLTPRHQQTFKWMAHRAEFVNWKDVPQDAPTLIEWQKRLDLAYPKDDQGVARHLELSDYLAMRRDYGVRYILIDRRVSQQSPLLPCVYPVDGEGNSTYAVFEITIAP